jgi:nucleoside-diphosphate-sugar epimerase
MRVFVTGATGFIGTLVVRELIDAGHQVLGLARSDTGAEALVAAGAQAHRGDIEDLESLRSGAASADGVVHLAYIHDVSRVKQTSEIDGRAIEALGAALTGSDRPLVVTSVVGIASTTRGQLATEDGVVLSSAVFPRAIQEEVMTSLVERGGNASAVRLPQVHDTTRSGLVDYAIGIAREKGVSAYVSDGHNRWPAVPVSDAAHLYRLALDAGAAGAKYNAVAEEGVPYRRIAEAIGQGLKLPVISVPLEKTAEHFGSLAWAIGWDFPASSKLTRERLGWNPTGPTLLEDLAQRFH